MANTLTALAPVLYSAAQEVSQEPIGFLNAINLNFDDKGAAVGDTIKLPLAPAAAEDDYTPAMSTTAGSNKFAESIEVSISASKQTSWHLTGEQIRSLQNADSDKEWVRQLIAQGMRTLLNGAEAAAGVAAYQGASRAYGTLGTAPFDADINCIAAIRKILRDNGAPMADLQMVFDTAAGYNLSKLPIFQQAQAAGSDEERRSGKFGRQFGFNLHESGQVVLHTAGTETTGPDCAGVDLVGDTAIAYDGGTDGNTFLKGDIVKNATKYAATTDLNLYVVGAKTTTAADTTGVITLNKPGLRVATAKNDEFAVQGAYRANVAFERSAIIGAVRPPIIPASPVIKQLPISAGNGLTFLLCEIVGDGMITWRLHLCYGFKAIQPEHIAILAG